MRSIHSKLAHSKFVLGLAVLAVLGFVVQGWGQESQVQGQAGVATGAPTLPAALAQVPAGKSEVTFANGQLTIKAHNAPLIEVVRAVCTQIGAELDAKVEPRAAVLGIMGPGPAKEVL